MEFVTFDIRVLAFRPRSFNLIMWTKPKYLPKLRRIYSCPGREWTKRLLCSIVEVVKGRVRKAQCVRAPVFFSMKSSDLGSDRRAPLGSHCWTGVWSSSAPLSGFWIASKELSGWLAQATKTGGGIGHEHGGLYCCTMRQFMTALLTLWSVTPFSSKYLNVSVSTTF